MPPRDLLFLDLDTSPQLEYLAEGAANVVYRLIQPPPSPSISSSLDLETEDKHTTTPPPSEIPPLRTDPRLEGQLIRLRKALPGAAPVIDSQKYFDSVIRPLFPPENLVDRTLFRPSAALIRDCNQQLRRMEIQRTRPALRHGTYLVEDEEYGTLITDMTPTAEDDGSIAVVVEFKPKWLTQSPSAPAGAKRCRTCALHAMKSSTNDKEVKSAKGGFCPLSLVSGDEARVATAVDIILNSSSRLKTQEENNSFSIVRRALINFLLNNPLLHHLRDLQQQLDPGGVFTTDLSAQDFLTAMTIRDCTLFLKIPTLRTTHHPISARLADLDLKPASALKAGYWRGVERELLQGEWYLGKEKETGMGMGMGMGMEGEGEGEGCLLGVG